MPITRFSVQNSVLSSVLYLPITTRPSYSFASSSITGAIAMHGPHHVAQKSITTGWPDAMISRTFSSVNVIVVCLMVDYANDFRFSLYSKSRASRVSSRFLSGFSLRFVLKCSLRPSSGSKIARLSGIEPSSSFFFAVSSSSSSSCRSCPGLLMIVISVTSFPWRLSSGSIFSTPKRTVFAPVFLLRYERKDPVTYMAEPGMHRWPNSALCFWKRAKSVTPE